MILGIECRIVGRVQMVMYRDFASRKARKLDLVGYVKNNDDGSVALFAEGEEEALSTYIKYLHRGPALSHVEQVETKWKEGTQEYTQFNIIYK